MGSSQSLPVKPGEIPAFLQRDDWCKTVMLTEPARFNEPKPYELLALSDDNWAALTLRVDPLARCIVDPHRMYAGAVFLCLLMTAVFSAVRPRLYEQSMDSHFDDTYFSGDDDTFDDYYVYQGDDFFYGPDDVVYSETMYREEIIQRKLHWWLLGFISVLMLLLASIVGGAMTMVTRNERLDDKIISVCQEMKPRFEAEGFTIEYRKMESIYLIFGYIRYIRPVRAFVFQRADTDNSSSKRYRAPSHDSDSRTHSTSASNSNSPYSTFMVKVPNKASPGAVLQVSTPSGRAIKVSVPLGVLPGEQFPVLIPTRFQRSNLKI